MSDPSMPANDVFKLDFNIAMLGATGVGKTSMLAAMWERFDQVFPDPDLQFIPRDETTRGQLSARLRELKTLAAGAPGNVDLSGSIRGTAEQIDHCFEFLHTGSDAAFDVTFTDHPGGWLEGDSPHAQKLETIIAEARLVIVCVDAPALMALDDNKHEAWNRPRDLSAVLVRALKQRRTPDRVILFAIMRGEKWLRNGKTSVLFNRFERRFSSALRVILGHHKTTAAVFCPVQTLGAVEFDRYEEAELERPTPKFVKIAEQDYQPVDCDQPLRHCMAYMLHALHRAADAKRREFADAIEGRPILRRWWDDLCSLFGVKSADQEAFEDWQARADTLLASLRVFAQGCKTTEGFRAIQNGDLLGL